MSNINNEYKKIVTELDSHIDDEKTLEYTKNQMYKLSMVFLEEMQNIADKYEDKMESLVLNQKTLEDKLQKIQNVVNNIEKDIYDEEMGENYDFEVTCPYCNNSFVVEIDELKAEIRMPRM